MRKIQIMMLALVAVVALGAVTASSAFALSFELAQWLVGGNVVTEAVEGTTTGELLLDDEGVNGAITCSGIFHVIVEPGGESDLLIISLLDLAGNAIGELTGNFIKCEKDSSSLCEKSSEASPIKVWALNFPWLAEAELDIETGAPWVLIYEDGKGLPTYHVTCLSFGLTAEDECNAAAGSGSEAKNVTGGGVEAIANSKVEPNGTCSIGGAGKGLVQNLAGNLTSVSGGLAISTPPGE